MDSCVVVSGTRPEIIKLAPVYFALKPITKLCWLHTGQHTSIADSAFEEFGISPDIVLNRPTSNTLNGLLSGLITSISDIIYAQQPRIVIVHGDTSSTLAGCLAAFHAQVPIIGHVEAGLRSGDLANPFPEEANRKLVAQLATRHYAPLESARQNLLREGVPDAYIKVTGNTVVDAQRILVAHSIQQDASHVLITCHRRENWQHMRSICGAIAKLAHSKPALTFKFVMHPNPALQTEINSYLSGIANVLLLQPLGYQALQLAIRDAVCVITDSGGIQEEAPSFGVKAVVVRTHTERMESVQAGMSVLAAPHCSDEIYHATLAFIEEGRQAPSYLYGDGMAAQRIADDITNFSE